MVDDLDNLEHKVKIYKNSIELFGKVKNEGYVLIVKDISTVLQIVDTLKYSFSRVLFFLVIFLGIILLFI